MNSSDQITPADDSSFQPADQDTPDELEQQIEMESGGDIPEEPTAEESPPVFVSWPPPGLERIHGAIWPVIRSFGLGGAIVVLPLLWTVVSKQNFWQLGPLGDHWWVLTITSGLGLVIVLGAIYHLLRILHEGRLAVEQGHGWLTVLQVAADDKKDTGFILQGARLYAILNQSEREGLLTARVSGAALYLLSAIWLSYGFILSVFLASRGVFSNRMIVLFTLLPAAVILALALYCRMRGYIIYFIAKRRTRLIVREVIHGQVAEWLHQFSSYERKGILGRGLSGQEVKFRAASIVSIVAGLFFLVSVSGFIFVNAVIPILMSVAIPRYQGIQQKVDLVELYRNNRLPPNPMISPQQAGQALHNINHTGNREQVGEFQQIPTRRHAEMWSFGRNRNSGMPTSLALLEMATSELSDGMWEALRTEARNPAHSEFEITGRAVSADIVGTRWQIPFPDTLTRFNLPYPRFSFSDAARSHLAKAAYELHSGQIDQAENTIREIISTGFLLIDEDTLLIGNLLGVVVVNIGGAALESFYRKTGRDQDAEALSRAQAEQEQLSKHRIIGIGGEDVESDLRVMADIILDDSIVRGLRWEMLPNITTIVPCMNLNRAVFGPGGEYTDWLDRAHESLVKRSSEEAMFDLVKYGVYASRDPQRRKSFVERVMGLMFGKSETYGGCAELYGIAAEALKYY